MRANVQGALCEAVSRLFWHCIDAMVEGPQVSQNQHNDVNLGRQRVGMLGRVRNTLFPPERAVRAGFARLSRHCDQLKIELGRAKTIAEELNGRQHSDRTKSLRELNKSIDAISNLCASLTKDRETLRRSIARLPLNDLADQRRFLHTHRSTEISDCIRAIDLDKDALIREFAKLNAGDNERINAIIEAVESAGSQVELAKTWSTL